MGMIRPLIKPSFKGSLRPALRTSINKISRYFTEFNAVAQRYILFGSALPLNGVSWEVEFSVYSVDIEAQAEAIVLGKLSDNRGFIRFSGGALSLNLSASNGTVTFADITVLNSELTTFSVVLDEDADTVTAKNISTGASQTLPVVTGNSNFEAISRKNILYTDNIYSNFKVWTGGDRDSGSLVLDMPIDQNYTPTSNTVIDRSPSGNNGTFVNAANDSSTLYQFVNGEWISENLLGSGVFNFNDGWIDNSAGTGSATIVDGVAVVSGTSFADRGDLMQTIPTTNGANYEIAVSIIEANNAFLVARSTTQGLIGAFNLPDGNNIISFTALSGITEISVRSQGGVSRFARISTKRKIEVAY